MEHFGCELLGLPKLIYGAQPQNLAFGFLDLGHANYYQRYGGSVKGQVFFVQELRLPDVLLPLGWIPSQHPQPVGQIPDHQAIRQILL